MSNATATRKVKSAPAAGPGRPSSFGNVETVPFQAHVPRSTRQMVRKFATDREININQALDQLIQRGFKEATR